MGLGLSEVRCAPFGSNALLDLDLHVKNPFPLEMETAEKKNVIIKMAWGN